MKARHFATALALYAGVSLASPTTDDGGGKNGIGDFFKALNAQPDTFAEYRFLTSPAVQQDEQLRNVGVQMLATDLSFLGRPVDAVRAFPFRGADKERDDLPALATHRAVPAVGWIASQSDAHRVVMINEAHHVAQTRVLTFALLRALRDKGYTHLAVETLANNGKPPMPNGYPVRDTGYYSREPVFAELLREARRLGYALLPYEPEHEGDQSQQQRESGQASVIAGLLQKDAAAKVLVHAGYAHIGESQAGLPDDARPMAMELAALTGLPLLTIDQTSPRSWETDEIDTVGRRLAQVFNVDSPSVLLAREGGAPWSGKPGLYDASVLLPATPAKALRPDWLSLGGVRHAVAVDLSPCLDRLPCLAEARHASEGDDAIPADQFAMLTANELDTPLYLAPGKYRLRLLGNDGAPLAQHELVVPAPSIASAETR